MSGKKKGGHLVLVGINYPDPKNPDGEKRADAGDVVYDLPSRAVAGLIEAGIIREAD